MSDFLQSIRNGNYSNDNRQRYNNSKHRRSYENTNGNYSRNNGNERKFRPRNDNHSKEETLKSIKEVLETIAQNQSDALVLDERRAVAEERKAAAFEFIASSFGNFTPPQQEKSKNQADPSPVAQSQAADKIDEPEQESSEPASVKSYEIIKSPNKEMDKDEVLAMILSMRNDGSTYNEIASHLVSLDLPTFSGRGKWHAQTIHRLCQSN